MIDSRRAALFMPLYVALMLALDGFFSSAAMGAPGELPIWLLVAFIAMAIAVFVIVGRYLFSERRHPITASRKRGYLAILAGVVVSGITNDFLAALASLTLHTRSIWVMVPIYTLTYLVLLTVTLWVLNRGNHATEPSARP